MTNTFPLPWAVLTHARCPTAGINSTPSRDLEYLKGPSPDALIPTCPTVGNIEFGFLCAVIVSSIQEILSERERKKDGERERGL